MDRKHSDIVIGSLLHDVGKMVFRCIDIDSRPHNESGYDFVRELTQEKDILEPIRFHHRSNLLNARVGEDSTAYITYIADNISSATDRRDVEGEQNGGDKFNKAIQLSPVFNILNNNKHDFVYSMQSANEETEVNYPKKTLEKDITAKYKDIYHSFKEGLKDVEFSGEYVNSIMELIESYFQYIPSSTITGQLSDISLYDHQKITAAIASCIYYYLKEQDITDYKEELLTNEKKFYEKEAFLLFSCDISGIQQFIYTIGNKAALKGLRARSFFLDIMLEHIADEILSMIGQYRTNLIYTGGGHAYMLLPNTAKTKKSIAYAEKTINKWLMDKFGILLYIAMDYVECSSNDIMNKPAEKSPYTNLYRKLSAKISKKKISRYTSDNLKVLNYSQIESQLDERECKVCGTSTRLAGDDICEMCSAFENISREIVRRDVCMVISENAGDGVLKLELPSLTESEKFLQIYSISDVKKKLCSDESTGIVRVYGKNQSLTGLRLASKIWFGDWYYRNDDCYMASFEQLAQKSQGAERIGVLRADVDNLGTAFVEGFKRTKEKTPEEINRYLTLSRTSALSRYLSRFFKYHINGIIEKMNIAVTIVYSGGDDMFIVGAWTDIIELALEIKKCFNRYTCNTLTISAGIGVYNSSYPIARMASETEALESAAKDNTKDSISIFGQELVSHDSENYVLEACHTYKWDEYENSVQNQKLKFLNDNFKKAEKDQESGTSGRGMSALYNLLGYIRGIQEDEKNIRNGKDTSRINLARCAYYLAKVENDLLTKEDNNRENTKAFTKTMYDWILNEKDRKELVTAMNLYSYSVREPNGGGN